ncbi:sugar transferase [Calothrix sp. UHCC 0171]|uniref:sugar transferase n=1 Tax=Calothrix sp. UHCC 0171 TaxID=3110245 RepID=UPI002B20E2DF|nr:sugar transferase [Calothrix sp. UHCC 0171]MEA5571676.1 sugar transferase [Calothrix sp. UHCC 0171]
MNTNLPLSLDNVALPEKLPPLVIIAFTRPELIKEVLTGVSQQLLLPQQIIAFVDGARKASDEPLISQCINLLEEFSSQIPVKIIARSQNLGCDKNIILAFTEVLSEYDSLIHLNDDIVPNRFFYDRMCRLLEAYRHHQEVFSISSYASLPEELDKSINSDFILSKRVFDWGFGIWADRWHDIDLVNRPAQYNPFGGFYNIPATIQTKLTLVNQFWLEHNNQTDWVITITIAALYKNKIHIIPTTSFIRNIGFEHPDSKTYKGKEPQWANARYDEFARPDSLPSSLELVDILKKSLNEVEFVRYLSAQNGLWLSPSAVWSLLWRTRGLYHKFLFLKLFITRIPVMLRRLRNGLPV